MKDNIKEFLSNYSDYYIDGNGKAHDIIRATPDELAEELVKLFAIPDVSSSVCKCPYCATEMKGIELTHYRCKIAICILQTDC